MRDNYDLAIMTQGGSSERVTCDYPLSIIVRSQSSYVRGARTANSH